MLDNCFLIKFKTMLLLLVVASVHLKCAGMNRPAVSSGESIFNLILLSMAVLFTESVFQFNQSLSNSPEIQKMDRRGEGGGKGIPTGP